MAPGPAASGRWSERRSGGMTPDPRHIVGVQRLLRASQGSFVAKPRPSPSTPTSTASLPGSAGSRRGSPRRRRTVSWPRPYRPTSAMTCTWRSSRTGARCARRSGRAAAHASCATDAPTADPASYAGSWGGPSLVGVFLVHSGPGFFVVVSAVVWLYRRRSHKERA
jgi:hypothetical protein